MNPEPEELFNKNQSLVYSILWRKFPTFAKDEDVRQEAMLGLWRACLTWDPKKSKFSTYSTKCIINHIYLYFRHQKKNPPEMQISLNTPIADTDRLTLADMLEESIPSIRDEQILFKDLIENLSPQEFQLVQAKMEGETQAEIANMLGISQPTCSKMLAKIKVRYERSIQEDD